MASAMPRVPAVRSAKSEAEGIQPRSCTGTPPRYWFTMLDWSQCPAVERIPGKVSGAWLFVGTRVPVKALFENLEGGATVDEFLAWFPGVTRTQVDAVLEHAQRSLAGVWTGVVRILFDQGTPVPLRLSLTAHEVVTAFEQGWGELENGDLLRAAETAGFEVIITTDQNLSYQQNLAGRKLSIVVLLTTDWRLIRRHTSTIETAVNKLVAGNYVELPFPPVT
jgi:uncharacterized protein (DUF433 family)